jgi:hypothetical protein
MGELDAGIAPSHLSITGSRREGWPIKRGCSIDVADECRGEAQHSQILQEGVENQKYHHIILVRLLAVMDMSTLKVFLDIET